MSIVGTRNITHGTERQFSWSTRETIFYKTEKPMGSKVSLYLVKVILPWNDKGTSKYRPKSMADE